MGIAVSVDFFELHPSFCLSLERPLSSLTPCTKFLDCSFNLTAFYVLVNCFLIYAYIFLTTSNAMLVTAFL